MSCRPVLNGLVRGCRHYSSAARLFIGGSRFHVQSEADARFLVDQLKPHERTHLLTVLRDGADADEDCAATEAAATREQLRALLWVNALPFVGFGLLDNMIMILAGEYIDVTLGVALGISTMAAAGLGNIISDVAGVGLAHYVEQVVARCGLRAPSLTERQWRAAAVRATCNVGRALGLVVGCLIGMFPLLFFDERDKAKLKSDIDHAEEN